MKSKTSTTTTLHLSRTGGLPHGADYYPEQWLDRPDILERDVELMQAAGITTVTLGVFAWSMLEPDEGRFDVAWLAERFDRLHRAGLRIALATPSGAPPRWLTRKYPELLRTAPDGRRNPPGRRLNFCPSSPRYRELTGRVATRLATEFGRHPALALWHVDNELAWSCHCASCQEQFRAWLRQRYASLDDLNRAWNTPFWSTRFSAWEEIAPPAILDGMEHQRHEDGTLPGLALDWRRFASWLNADFLRHEIAAIRAGGSTAPVTTNTWGVFGDFDPRHLDPLLDVAAADSYPAYKALPGEERLSSQYAFTYDAYRSFKGGQPFLLLETSPGMTHGPVGAKLKRPGQHRLACLQAIAHGADSVFYFQWRQSRGGSEQFCSGVVGNDNRGDTRMFGEIASLGKLLAKLGGVVGSRTPVETALVFDRDIHWAMLSVHGFHATDMNYPGTCLAHYDALRALNVPLDVIHQDAPLDAYRLVVAPMLFLLRPGVAERLQAFVERGGCLVGTYLSGYLDPHGGNHLGDLPGPLRNLFGLTCEELDVLVDGPISRTGWLAQLPLPPRPLAPNRIAMAADNVLGLRGEYDAAPFCERIRCETAAVQAHYVGEFYAGSPALTVNRLGQGAAWFVASRNEPRFLADFYAELVARQAIRRTWAGPLPPAVRVNERIGEAGRYLFFQNYGTEAVDIELDGQTYAEIESESVCAGRLALPAFGVAVLRCPDASTQAT